MSVKSLGHSVMGTPLGLGLGELAQAGGRIFYVDSEKGRDGNTGLEPNTAKLTVNAAYAACTTNKNDVIVLIPRATQYAIAASAGILTWSKDYVHMVGAWAGNAGGARCRVVMPDAVSTPGIALSGDGCVFKNIQFLNSSNVAASGALVITGNRNCFINCKIAAMIGATSAASATAYTIKLTGAQENYFKNCVIGQDTVARTTANKDVVFSTGARDNTFEDCRFIMLAGSNAEFWLDLSAASCVDGVTVFKDCLFLNSTKSGGTALTLGFSVNASGIGGLVVLKKCMFFGAAALCANTIASVITDGAAAAGLGGLGLAAHTS